MATKKTENAKVNRANLIEAAKNKLAIKFGHIDPDGLTKLETEEILERPLTIIDYDFGVDKSTGVPFAVVIFKEFPDAFYFGGMVLTDLLTTIESDEQLKDELLEYGLPVSLGEKKGKNKKTYVTVEILDE